jgi:hypothetical protein
MARLGRSVPNRKLVSRPLAGPPPTLISLTDSGSAVDVLTVPTVGVALTDTATATDVLTVPAVVVSLADAATAVDTFVSRVFLPSHLATEVRLLPRLGAALLADRTGVAELADRAGTAVLHIND